VGPDVRLEHPGSTTLTLRGTATGRVYVFRPAEPVQAVASGDAPALLRSGLVRRAR
jgi:hypothetical protein